MEFSPITFALIKNAEKLVDKFHDQELATYLEDDLIKNEDHLTQKEWQKALVRFIHWLDKYQPRGK